MPLGTLPPFQYCQPRMPYVEDVERYAPGGYHPVDIGDTICNGERAYEVIHKLGHGGFSTVCTSERSSALGIRTWWFCMTRFKISGPNGKHCCLAFPVLGPSLQKINVSAALSSNMRHQVCQQVASAMAFLHHHGVCHGVFELPDIQSMSPARVSQLLGPVKAENLRLTNGLCSPHAPKQVIQTPDLSGLDCSLLTQIRIIDFGQAFFTDRPPPSLGVPIDSPPPPRTLLWLFTLN
ncbi:protein kinase domain-containing protein, partial [Metarhizium hybridum]